MTSPVTRRAFLLGLAGAAAAGWVWLRERPAAEPTEIATSPTTSRPVETDPPPAPSSTSTTTTEAPVPTTTATTTTTLAPVLIEALCRDSWGARAPTGAFTSHSIERMTVHHTARVLATNANAPRAIRGHQNFHQQDRGWADIAYHFVIDLEGNVYECRPTGAVGDTGTNYDPTGHFLVCCEGDFNNQELPAAQLQALIDVLAWAATEFDVAPDTIAGHRDVAATSCPGDNLYPLIESGAMADAVARRLAAGGAALEVICGEEAQQRVEAIENA